MALRSVELKDSDFVNSSTFHEVVWALLDMSGCEVSSIFIYNDRYNYSVRCTKVEQPNQNKPEKGE